MNSIQSANKTTASVLGGAAAVILIWALNKYGGADIDATVGGSIQVILTAAVVYFGPKNAQ